MGIGKAFGSFFRGVGSAGIGAGKMGFGAGKNYGGKIVNRGARTIRNNPSRVIGATAAAAGAGALLADADGQANEGAMATGAGLAGFGLASMSGTAGSAMALGGVGTATAVGMGLSAAYSVGKMSVKVPTRLNFETMGQLRPTAIGLGLIGGSALVEGAVKAKDEFYKSRMGTHDGQARGPTPIVPQELDEKGSYVDNAGATGDLVFALNKLRNGG